MQSCSCKSDEHAKTDTELGLLCDTCLDRFHALMSMRKKLENYCPPWMKHVNNPPHEISWSEVVKGGEIINQKQKQNGKLHVQER